MQVTSALEDDFTRLSEITAKRIADIETVSATANKTAAGRSFV
jgi:hypothetical protein